MNPDPDQPAWAVRLEKKMDAILEALTAEDIGDLDQTGVDLEGQRLFSDRDQSQEL